MDFHVTIDFNDDIWFADGPWNESLLRELIRTYAANGISTIHWIDNGGQDDGMYDPGTWMDRLAPASEFFRRVPRPLEVVADEARRLGLRTFAVLKVFDLAFGMPWASQTPAEAAPGPQLTHVGGVGCGLHWIRQHPHVRSALHPSLQEALPRRPIETIRLWHENDQLAPGSWRLFVSSDNRNYHPYAGPVNVRQAVVRRRPPVFVTAPQRQRAEEGGFSCVEFSGLNLAAPFFAVEAVGQSDLANKLIALAEMTDVEGREVAFTYGLIPMQKYGAKCDWRSDGIAFDAAYGTDILGRGWQMVSSGGGVRVSLGKSGFLGLARGRNDHLTGVLEPAYPEVRDWLTGLATRAIDQGCDGVDIRISTHTESLDWDNYGFNEPVLDEFRRRHGVDPATAPFDRAAWRRLRGEFFDAFLEQVSGAVRDRGGKLLAHLSDRFDQPVEEYAWYGIHFDWRKWLQRGWVDGATLDSFTFRERFYWEALVRCRSAGVPAILRPSMHSADDEAWRTYGNELIDRAVADGLAAFNIYESAAVTRLEGGKIRLQAPSLWERIAGSRQGQAFGSHGRS